MITDWSPNLPETASRAEQSTSPRVNDLIEAETRARIARVAAQGPLAITERLRQLDAEWDIERTLQANAASVSALSLVLGWQVNRRWYALTGIVAGFLLQHALQGWCPPLPILRRLGFRSIREIEAKRLALRILRGDFGETPVSPDEAFEAAQRA